MAGVAMKKTWMQKGNNYRFADYFDLNQPTKEIIEAFGYTYRFAELTLPERAEHHTR